jgi:hypothetical protein
MSYSHEPIDQERRVDSSMRVYVAVLVFWLTAIALGAIDVLFIPGYDFRILTFLTSVLAAWGAVRYYDTREREKRGAT